MNILDIIIKMFNPIDTIVFFDIVAIIHMQLTAGSMLINNFRDHISIYEMDIFSFIFFILIIINPNMIKEIKKMSISNESNTNITMNFDKYKFVLLIGIENIFNIPLFLVSIFKSKTQIITIEKGSK